MLFGLLLAVSYLSSVTADVSCDEMDSVGPCASGTCTSGYACDIAHDRCCPQATMQAPTSTSPAPTLICNDSASISFFNRSPVRSNFISYVDTSPCMLGSTTVKTECSKHQVFVMIMLTADSTPAGNHLQEIKKFMDDATKYCGQGNYVYVFTPKSYSPTNAGTEFTGGSGLGPIDNLTLSEVSVSTDTAADVFASMLDAVSNCAKTRKLPTNTGGTLFVFSDFSPCNTLCNVKDLGAIQSTTNNFLDLSYSIRYNFLRDDQKEEHCVRQLFATCEDHKDVCDAHVYVNSTLAAAATSQSVCVKGEAPANGMSTTLYVVAIAVPSLCTLVIVLVCVYICYRRRSANSKILSQVYLGFLGYTPTIGEDGNPMHASMNQYTDIRSIQKNYKKDEWEISPKNLTILDDVVLGSGAFANVFKGTLKGKIPLLTVYPSLNLSLENHHDAVCEVAVKRLPVHADDAGRVDFFHEIDFMKRLGYHAHVVSMLGCVSNTFDPLIAAEFCSNGDLLKYLRLHRNDFLEDGPGVEDSKGTRTKLIIKDLVSIAWQVCDGLEYLASNKFIHRDLAARNVLLTKNMVAKISDFGLCRYVDSNLYTAKGGRLPIKWMAIESLKFYEYTTKSDVWAYGVMLFELFSIGDGPYPAIQPVDMIEHLDKGERLPQPPRCPNEIYEIMTRCWDADKDKRPDVGDMRAELSAMLNMDDAHYGYLQLPSVANLKIVDEEDDDISSMDDISKTSL